MLMPVRTKELQRSHNVPYSSMYKTFRNISLTIVVLLVVGDLISISTYIVHMEIYKITDQQARFVEKIEFTATERQDSDLKPFVQVGDAKVFLYSAIWRSRPGVNETIAQNGSTLVINAWKYRKLAIKQFTCCFLLSNKTVISRRSTDLHLWVALLYPNVSQAAQYRCRTHMKPSTITGVTIALRNNTCATSTDFYLEPTLLPDISNTNTQIAACTKLSYASLSAGKLLEWIEAHRLLGVTKILAYTYKLNDAAMSVFEYYKRIGLVDTYAFGLPEAAMKRDVGWKNRQAWHDEQVVALDCQERLQNYQYVALVDTDEYILPNVKLLKNSWKPYLNKKFGKHLGGLQFYTRVHVLSWFPTDPSHAFFIGQYGNVTAPMFDRPKSIYMPSRIKLGSVHTHGFDVKEGYKKRLPSPKEVNLHHYRACRDEWLPINKNSTKKKKADPISIPGNKSAMFNYKNDIKCYDFKRYPDRMMAQLIREIKENVLNASMASGVNTHPLSTS